MRVCSPVRACFRPNPHFLSRRYRTNSRLLIDYESLARRRLAYRLQQERHKEPPFSGVGNTQRWRDMHFAIPRPRVTSSTRYLCIYMWYDSNFTKFKLRHHDVLHFPHATTGTHVSMYFILIFQSSLSHSTSLDKPWPQVTGAPPRPPRY